MHTHIHAYTHTCIHTYMHTHIHAYTHTCIHTYMHTHIHAYTYMHTHICIHTYTYTYMHTHTVFPNRSFFQGPVPLRDLLRNWVRFRSFFWEKGPLNLDIVGKIWFGLHRIILQETSKPTKATKCMASHLVKAKTCCSDWCQPG